MHPGAVGVAVSKTPSVAAKMVSCNPVFVKNRCKHRVCLQSLRATRGTQWFLRETGTVALASAFVRERVGRFSVPDWCPVC